MIAAISSNLTHFVAACVAIGSICTALWSTFSYVHDVKASFESSQANVSSLEKRYQALESKFASVSAAGAVKGEQGERGPQGVPGPMGPAGPAGAGGARGGETGLTKTDVQKMIDQAFVQKTASLKANPIEVSAANAQTELMVPDNCMHRDKFRASSSLILKAGLEFCNTEGELLDKVDNVSKEVIKFFTPGKGTSWCSLGQTCRMGWEKDREFYIERINEGENSKFTALIRIKSKSN